MLGVLITLVAYLLGYYIAYNLFLLYCKEEGTLTTFDYRFSAAFALLSWFGVLTGLILVFAFTIEFKWTNFLKKISLVKPGKGN